MNFQIAMHLTPNQPHPFIINIVNLSADIDR